MARDEGSGFLYFLLGTAVGAGLGILFAPKSGKETREELADWLDDRREKGADFLARMKEKVPEKKDQFVAAVKAGKQALYEATGKHNHVEKEPAHS